MLDASSALDRMIERTNALVLDARGVAERTVMGDWILLFSGDPTARPEVADLAVILPEIVKGRAGAIHFAVIDGEAEEALAAEMGVFVKPTLVFIREGAVMGIIPRIKDWAYYEQMLEELLPLGGMDRRASA